MNSSKKFNPVLQFKTLQEEADFWDTHDSMEYELEDTDEMVELSDEQKAKIRARWEKRKRATIRLSTEQLDAVEKIANQKQVDYRELIQEWLNLHIADELKSSANPVS
jgi:predicted DNA binding CopG/RHH family protein